MYEAKKKWHVFPNFLKKYKMKSNHAFDRHIFGFRLKRTDKFNTAKTIAVVDKYYYTFFLGGDIQFFELNCSLNIQINNRITDRKKCKHSISPFSFYTQTNKITKRRLDRRRFFPVLKSNVTLLANILFSSCFFFLFRQLEIRFVH